jgi:hypothetical protein
VCFSCVVSFSAVTCLLAAAKMEEVYPPLVSELAAATAGSCAARDIIAFERDLYQALDWQLAPPTPQDWADWCDAMRRPLDLVVHRHPGATISFGHGRALEPPDETPEHVAASLP